MQMVCWCFLVCWMMVVSECLMFVSRSLLVFWICSASVVLMIFDDVSL